MTLHTLYHTAINRLTGISPNPAADAEYLLLYLLQENRSFLFLNSQIELSPQLQSEFEALLTRRLKGEPIAYLLGKQGFWKHDFKVSPHTLIPRSETELLVEKALTYLNKKKPATLLDLGTGTGAIGISLALESPNWQVYATDLSPQTLALARENALDLRAQNIDFVISNWFSAFCPAYIFDLILANPPYIAECDEHLAKGDLRFEPFLALASGKEGLGALKEIIGMAPPHLKNRGRLIVEHGYDQKEAVQSLFKKAGFTHIQTFHDLQNWPRITTGQLENETLVIA